MTNNYNTHDSDRVPIIMNWLDQEDLMLMQTLNDKKQEKF